MNELEYADSRFERGQPPRLVLEFRIWDISSNPPDDQLSRGTGFKLQTVKV